MGTISLCIIARDEEAMLPGCLDSARGAVDQVVVVDTGSCDRTVERAHAAGATVVSFAWCDDFAAARNAALPHATGDWILVLDADERLAPGAGAALRQAIDSASMPAAGLLPLHEALSVHAAPADVVAGRQRHGEPVWLPRLLRRTADLRWQGCVHEHVDAWLGRHGGAARAIAAPIVHLGGDPARRARLGKPARNRALLERRCADDPADAPAHGYLALELLDQGRAAEASAVAERGWAAWARAPRQPALRLAVARGLCALARGDAAAAAESALVGLSRAGESGALRYVAGCAAELAAVRAGQGSAERRARAEEAVASQRAARARADAPELDRVIFGATRWLAATRLGHALLLLERPDEALAAYADALAERAGHAEALLGRAEALLELGRPHDALAALEPVLGRGADAWLLAAAAAAALGAIEDARSFVGRVLDGSSGPVEMHRGERLARLCGALGLVAGRAA